MWSGTLLAILSWSWKRGESEGVGEPFVFLFRLWFLPQIEKSLCCDWFSGLRELLLVSLLVFLCLSPPYREICGKIHSHPSYLLVYRMLRWTLMVGRVHTAFTLGVRWMLVGDACRWRMPERWGSPSFSLQTVAFQMFVWLPERWSLFLQISGVCTFVGMFQPCFSPLACRGTGLPVSAPLTRH